MSDVGPGATPAAEAVSLNIWGLVGGGLVGALAAGAGVALHEALGAGLGAADAVAVFGLLFPVWLVLGLVAALAGGLVARGRPVSAAALGLGLVLTLVLIPVASQLALGGFIVGSAEGAGAAAAALVLVASALAALGSELLPVVKTRVSSTAAGRLGWGVALVAGALGVYGLVSWGTTSGAGGAARILGVLRREELGLTVPYSLLAVVSVGASGAYRLARSASARAPWALGAGGGLIACLGALVFADARLSRTPSALALEANSALGGPAVRLWQGLSDRDGDGAGARFGGGDCNDADPAIFPTAQDIAGNGVDEDCSGADAVLESPAAEVPAAPAALPDSAALPRAKNLLLITIDTLRYDLGYAGNKRPLSPRLDELAARSVVYERAYSLASYTGKSLPPMMIGRYPSETHRGFMHFNKYPAEDVMLQERLQQEGLHTVSVQGHWYFKANTGLGRGFDVLDLSGAPRVAQGEGDRTVNSDKISDAAIGFLQGMGAEKPFFMWVHYLDPHAEYVPHEDFVFGKDQRALYDGEVAFTDHHVGRVLDALKARPELAQDTAIIVTSDHGEAFREHGMVRHGFELWEELVRVPLIVYVPGVAPQRLDVRRSAIDIAPTVVELLLDSPAPHLEKMSGTSLVAEVGGQAVPGRPVFVDMPDGPYNGERQALIADGTKLITSRLRPMGLYDLDADPGETKNLVRDTARVAAELERLKKFRNELQLVFVKPR